ncbi:HPP family protein [Salarchaeum sp. JOR-1]|uniref:HPP family protein n=1 Tax=Salarchaeum sp. JOR-1 TaxID=2599399 RepID=UPI001198613D|nr:HPP family protein [Salarchaeum sp. JOR-1]QDX40698.1 HPP family protein [Salarchaeum sp. JOR-1]
MLRTLVTGVHAAGLFCVLGVLAWLSGEPFVFPSLGPTAFVLAFGGVEGARRRVVGGHAIGAVAGFLAYTLLAGHAVLTAGFAPATVEGARLAASGTLSVALTAWGMLALDAVHPPACATTLIVSLGLLATPFEVAIIVASVGVLLGAHELANVYRKPET